MPISQEFHQVVDNCVNIADDMVMYGFNEDGPDHDQTLMAVLQITQANNLKINPDKCIFCATQVSFFRHLNWTQTRSPEEKSPAVLLGCPYRELLPNPQPSVNAANHIDQNFIQQNHLQMQEKHNARLGPKPQTIIQMQLNEGQYVMFVSNPDASHGFTWTH